MCNCVLTIGFSHCCKRLCVYGREVSFSVIIIYFCQPSHGVGTTCVRGKASTPSTRGPRFPFKCHVLIFRCFNCLCHRGSSDLCSNA